MKATLFIVLLLSTATRGVLGRVGGDDSNVEKNNTGRRKAGRCNKFSICSLDDPRLKNPWAPLPHLHQQSSAKGENLEKDRVLQSPENEPNEYPNEPKMTQHEYWEVVIVGAGPGGITAAKTIIDASPTTKVLILERGPSLDFFRAKGYDDALQHGVATGDPEFREDVEGTPIVVGTGVGGGTLHFGMQFIDQDEVADASSRQPEAGAAGDLREEVGIFADMTGATSYTDEEYYSISSTVGDTYTNFISEINANSASFGGKLYRNKVYKTATGIDDQPRLLVGELLENTNVQIRTGMEVLALVDEGPDMPNSILYANPDGTQSRLFSDHIVIAAGALNSARMALNAGIVTPTGHNDDGTPYLGPLWDHQGLVVTYFAPGTTFTNASETSVAEEFSTGLGLPVFDSIEAAQETTSGFVGFIQLPVLTSQDQVDSLTSAGFGGMDQPDPPAAGKATPTSLILEISFPRRIREAIKRAWRGGIEFDYTTVDVAGDQVIGHLQTRPDNHDWQYYFTTAGDANLIVGVSTTGEAIEDNGRVYAGDALGPSTVDLPTLEQEGFDALMEGLKKNHEIMINMGFFTDIDLDAITDIATLETMPGYLRTTYHYHGTLSQTTLSPGFYSGDLARMKSKWAGSTSVAAAAMGIQAGKEVLCQLGASCE